MKYSKLFLSGLVMLAIAGVFVFWSGAKKRVDKPKSEEEIIQEKLSQRTPKQPLKIGFITDVHAYGKKVAGQWQINWRSQEAIERFIQKMNNEFKPDLVIEDGDLVDGKDKNSKEDWLIVDKMLQTLKTPYYHVIGNHEMRSFDKATWLQLTGYDKPYYYRDIKGYRIIVLDGNHFPGGKDTGPEKEYYPGVLGNEQWQWLESVLKDAALNDKDPIVFIHQPPISTDAKPNWALFPEGEKLHQLFNKYKVRAVFSGHIERLCDIKDGATEYFVLQGMWKANAGLKKEYRFKDAGNFYYITITPDKVEVKGEYRIFHDKNQSSKKQRQERVKKWETLVLNPQEYNCQDGQRLDPKKRGLSIKEETGDSRAVVSGNSKGTNNKTAVNEREERENNDQEKNKETK